jgi:hypothetical protein
LTRCIRTRRNESCAECTASRWAVPTNAICAVRDRDDGRDPDEEHGQPDAVHEGRAEPGHLDDPNATPVPQVQDVPGGTKKRPGWRRNVQPYWRVRSTIASTTVSIWALPCPRRVWPRRGRIGHVPRTMLGTHGVCDAPPSVSGGCQIGLFDHGRVTRPNAPSAKWDAPAGTSSRSLPRPRPGTRRRTRRPSCRAATASPASPLGRSPTRTSATGTARS